ncbi:MAG: hypothetical protein EKK37_07875 [Sphingobacteriales bacterium]|nr:MAG: hypothetical protein EKK37_07875 [Sphingobacteriales bacterium]
MKSIAVFTLAAMFTLTSCAIDGPPITAAKSEKNINKEAMANFANEFKNASDVTWDKEEDFSFAHFILGNERLVAAYDETGKHISTSRFIEFSELPLAVTLNVKERFPEAVKIGRVAEVVFDNYASYYFTIVTKKQVLRIKSSADGYINVMERQKILNQK